MRKTLSLVALAVMSATVQAQTPASPQSPDPAMAPGTTQTDSQPRAATDAAVPQTSQKTAQVQAANISAELTKGIDSKKAKVGDPVNAKTTTDAKLPDGTDLPKGTKLVGNVVEVKAKSKEENNSHLVLALNRAVLKDGHEMPIRAAVTSMTAPTSNTSFDTPGGGGSAGGGMPSGGGGSAGAGGSGGSSGGGGGGGTASPSMSSMPSGSSSQARSVQGEMGEMLKSAQDRVAVGNKPKVMLSAPTTPESAGILDAQGENISLDSGTQFTANVASAQSAGQGQ
ncbi:MAG TPA: hypothetical protein VK596_04735 [Edaphobacter sp.]|nr:hypothetical protein [Edaphobacter sp.]